MARNATNAQVTPNPPIDHAHPPTIVRAPGTWPCPWLPRWFLEAPQKFRAPDVTLRVGLGIGRIVFRA